MDGLFSFKRRSTTNSSPYLRERSLRITLSRRDARPQSIPSISRRSGYSGGILVCPHDSTKGHLKRPGPTSKGPIERQTQGPSSRVADAPAGSSTFCSPSSPPGPSRAQNQRRGAKHTAGAPLTQGRPALGPSAETRGTSSVSSSEMTHGLRGGTGTCRRRDGQRPCKALLRGGHGQEHRGTGPCPGLQAAKPGRTSRTRTKPLRRVRLGSLTPLLRTLPSPAQEAPRPLQQLHTKATPPKPKKAPNSCLAPCALPGLQEAGQQASGSLTPLPAQGADGVPSAHTAAQHRQHGSTCPSPGTAPRTETLFPRHSLLSAIFPFSFFSFKEFCF